MDNKTLSLHGGKTASLAHNRREQGKEGKHSTIKNELTENNVTLIDIDIKEAYKQLFSEAVDDYNKTQKRSDRKIKNYYSKIHSDKKKNTHYEYIFQLGNIKNRIDDDTFITVCSDYVASFQERNPNLFLVGAYIHLDEEASPHMHMDYIPIGHYDKGMRLQTSSNKAFEELTNYKSQSKRDTAQIKWQESEREYIKSFCRDYGIEVIDGDSKGKKSLSIAEYKAQQDMKQAQQAIEQAELLKQNADAEIKAQDARIQSAKQEADKQLQEQQKRTQEQLDAMQQEIDDRQSLLTEKQEKYNKIRDKLNKEYDDLVDRNEQKDIELTERMNVLESIEQTIKDHAERSVKEFPSLRGITKEFTDALDDDVQQIYEQLDELER